METLRVLVVDDEPGMRMGVQRALRDYTFPLQELDGVEAGFEVHAAETGEQGLELIEEHAPDIVLLDHKLPGISGLDVLETMNERKVEALTIMITAYASIETAVKATREGAYDFLPKPFTPQELKYSVKKAASRVILAKRAKALEEEKKRVRFEFIRVLGHELKAPLGAVESYLDMLETRALGESVEEYDLPIKRCMGRIAQMRKLIIDLLDMTRLESGEKRRDLQPTDLVEAARSTIEMLTPQATDRGIKIALHGPESLTLDADRGELDMMFNNLISNAVKYNRDNGRVDVTLTDTDGTITIEVKDTGIGMSEEEVQKLFGEFVRIRNSKTKDILGSGLGLSILKRLSSLYNGDVSVTSEPDVGTTFAVTLNPGNNSAPDNSKDDTAE